MMKRTTACPICSGKSIAVQSAFISPWLRDLGSIRTRRSKYHICQSCESGFFDYRYSSSEMEGIYSGYRGSRYFNIRNSYEPSYTTELNNALGHDQEVLSIRHEFVRSAIARAIVSSTNQVATVIDVGGDQGQFIPPEFPHKYVLDVSDKPLTFGVERVADNTQAAQLKPDLVMACGILEHLPNPVKFVTDLTNIGEHGRELLIYIEVPGGVPIRRPISQRVLGQLCGQIASRSRFVWSRLDRYSARSRRKGKSAAHLMPLRQSEHINFFSLRGLERLAKRVGANVLLIDEVDMPSALLANGRLQFSTSLRLLIRTERE